MNLIILISAENEIIQVDRTVEDDTVTVQQSVFLAKIIIVAKNLVGQVVNE